MTLMSENYIDNYDYEYEEEFGDKFGDEEYEDYQPTDPKKVIPLSIHQPNHGDLKFMVQLIAASSVTFYNSYQKSYATMAERISWSMKSSKLSSTSSVWAIKSKEDDGSPRILEIKNDKKEYVGFPTEDAETIMTDICIKIAAGLMIQSVGDDVADPVTLIVSYIKLKYWDVTIAGYLEIYPDRYEVGDREESVDLHADWSNPKIMAKVADYEDSYNQNIEPFPRSNHPWCFGPDGLPFCQD